MVDDVTEEKKRRLLSTTKWKSNVVTAISTWPCLNVLKELSASEYKGKSCAGCQHNNIYARVLLYGQPYNSTTLEGSPPDPRIPQEKVLCAQWSIIKYIKIISVDRLFLIYSSMFLGFFVLPHLPKEDRFVQ